MGSAPRATMRAQGLWHASGVVLVRSGDGKAVYVHRRGTDKDIYPGTWDCWAGGVVLAGESPGECAKRELAEELGIDGVIPVPLFTLAFEDGSVRCHNFAFEVRWDGPILHQPEEIVDGRWMSLVELRAWADEPDSTFIPDGRQAIREWFRRYA